MNALAQTLRSLGMMRVLILGGVGIALVFFFVFMGGRLTAPNMALLYGNLESSDTSDIVGRLESMGVPYELQGDGSQILVPVDRVLKVRMSLAGDGLPGGGTVGYEIFDQSDGFGTTNLVQNINMLRALEGELARTIASLDGIASARVHLVIPKRELFNEQRAETSASIALNTRGSGRLTRQQVAAIQNLVAAAVPGLDAQSIAIIDDEGNLLARGGEGDLDGAAGASGAEDFRVAYENRVKNTVESLLERSIGLGKVRAEVSAEIDFDRFTTNDEVYDPEGQVVRSQQVVEERNESADADNNLSVSAANNLPDADPLETANSSSNLSERLEETTNYEISRTVRTHVREAGTVKRLSIAVLVDGRYTVDDAGERLYEPRSEEDLAQLTQLVRSAVGFDEQRGDTIDVVNMQFAEISIEEGVEEGGLGLGNVDIMKVLEVVVLGFVAVLVIMLVLRPLVAKAMNAPGDGFGHPALAGPDGAIPQLPPQPQMVAPAPPPQPIPAAPPPPKPAYAPDPVFEEEEEDTLIDIAKVEGRVKQSHVRKIGEIVDKHPEEALNIVRNWLYSD